MTKTLRALGSGLAGAAALTLVHQTARALTDLAPRADILGMRAIAKAVRKTGAQSPPDDQLYRCPTYIIWNMALLSQRPSGQCASQRAADEVARRGLTGPEVSGGGLRR